jgi:hypothetical protein
MLPNNLSPTPRPHSHRNRRSLASESPDHPSTPSFIHHGELLLPSFHPHLFLSFLLSRSPALAQRGQQPAASVAWLARSVPRRCSAARTAARPGQPTAYRCGSPARRPDVPYAARPASALEQPAFGAAWRGLRSSPVLDRCPCTVVHGPRASLACPCAAQCPGVLRAVPVHLQCVSFVESHQCPRSTTACFYPSSSSLPSPVSVRSALKSACVVRAHRACRSHVSTRAVACVVPSTLFSRLCVLPRAICTSPLFVRALAPCVWYACCRVLSACIVSRLLLMVTRGRALIWFVRYSRTIMLYLISVWYLV